jgi:hypothetical protein
MNKVLTTLFIVVWASKAFAATAAINTTPQPVNLTGVGTLWEQCNLQKVGGVAFFLVNNPGGNKVQMQMCNDQTCSNFTPNSDGMPISVEGGPVDATSSTTNTVIVWPSWNPCMRLQVLSGSGSLTGVVTLTKNFANMWAQGWPYQTFATGFSESTTALSKTSTVLIPSSGVAQRLEIINTGPSLVWCSFGNNAVDGAPSIPLPVNGKGINLDRPTGTTRDSINCKTDSSAATLSSLTIVFQ